jgi:hypothetical protein
VLVNLEAANKMFKPKAGVAHDLSDNDSYLVIRNSEVMCGCMDKATVGDGKKDSVFYVMMRDFGPQHAVQGMNRLSKLSARWLSNNGFSLGISDVTPGEKLMQKKQALVSATRSLATTKKANCHAILVATKRRRWKTGLVASCPTFDKLLVKFVSRNSAGGILPYSWPSVVRRVPT